MAAILNRFCSPWLCSPVRACRPPKARPRELVVLLHGYGADGNDLIGLAPHWQELLPGAAFVAPHAPDRVPGAPSGFQWFPISRIDPA